MNGIVVRHQNPFKTPFVSENRGQQEDVFATKSVGPGAIHGVISAHDGGHMTHFDSSFEWRQIDFSQRALIHCNMHIGPVFFFVVANHVFGASPDSLSLDPFDLFGIQLATQKWVFTRHVFEISTSHWHSIEIHSRAENAEISTGPSVTPHGNALIVSTSRIPGSGQR